MPLMAATPCAPEARTAATLSGVTPERAPEVLASGGHGVAAIRGIWDAPSPPDAVQAYLDAVEADVGETGKPGESSDL